MASHCVRHGEGQPIAFDVDCSRVPSKAVVINVSDQQDENCSGRKLDSQYLKTYHASLPKLAIMGPKADKGAGMSD